MECEMARCGYTAKWYVQTGFGLAYLCGHHIKKYTAKKHALPPIQCMHKEWPETGKVTQCTRQAKVYTVRSYAFNNPTKTYLCGYHSRSAKSSVYTLSGTLIRNPLSQ